jgi:hypothetical protein
VRERRLETKILRTPEHVQNAKARRSQAMLDLIAISRDTLEVQQRHESFEA